MTQRPLEVWLDWDDETRTPVDLEFYDGVIVWGDQEVMTARRQWRVDWQDPKKLTCGSETCLRVSTQDEGFAALGSVQWILYDAVSMIAVENLIAAAALAGTKVAAVVQKSAHVPGTAFALESGVDAVVLPLDADDAKEAAGKARSRRGDVVPVHKVRSSVLEVAVVDRVVSGVVADRVAIDLVQLLEPGEGALVGSASAALVLAHGETLPSPLVPPRPFRVNAGPVHSYVLLADGTTKYLSELRPCDVIAIVNTRQKAHRSIAVGRLKIESRPHLCIHFSRRHRGTSSGTVFLQQAETVRVLVLEEALEEDDDDAIKSVNWLPTSVTDLKVGDLIAASFADGFGTHCGTSIAARVIER